MGQRQNVLPADGRGESRERPGRGPDEIGSLLLSREQIGGPGLHPLRVFGDFRLEVSVEQVLAAYWIMFPPIGHTLQHSPSAVAAPPPGAAGVWVVLGAAAIVKALRKILLAPKKPLKPRPPPADREKGRRVSAVHRSIKANRPKGRDAKPLAYFPATPG